MGRCDLTGPIASDEVEVSIVMPCLNEAETVVRCIEKALRAFDDNRLCGEVIIADNGSSDGSQSLASAAGRESSQW